MPEWRFDTLEGLAKYVRKEVPRAMRRSTQATLRGDDGIELGTQAGIVADAANQAAEAAQAQAGDAAAAAADAAQQAADAAGIAGGKANVFMQSTEPDAQYRVATTLWIDTTGGANTPKRWSTTASPPAWVAVTDKTATDAAAAAVAAQSLAQSAKDTADLAKQTADAAQAAATNALTSANGKNTIRFRTAAPTTSAEDAGKADGDLWFVIPNVQTGIVTGQYTWMAANQAWVQQTLSSAVLASIDAGKITTGTLVGITITGVTITGATVTGGTVQTSATGKRVVLADNLITFYGVDGSTAVKGGVIEGVPNGAAGGMVHIGPAAGDGRGLYVGTQALPTRGSADVRVPGTSWFDDIYVGTSSFDSVNVGTGGVTTQSARITATGDASPTSTGHGFQIGPDSGANLIADQNEIMARSNGVPAALYINGDGGNLGLGGTSSTVTVPGKFMPTASYFRVSPTANVPINGTTDITSKFDGVKDATGVATTGMFSTANGFAVSASQAGMWMLSLSIRSVPGGQAFFRLNGVYVAFQDGVNATLTAIMPLFSGDVIKLFAYSTSSTTSAYTATGFTAVYLGSA